ncbi:glutathione S-transferase domain-containing protein [Mycena galopus ATCC 62051]|nr:glutathione S-transferase domain-containing protein [Mycena galopus ATCC 62051]
MTSPTLFLHDHPVSSYAQKIRIALREKDIPFNRAVPDGFGLGKDVPTLSAANPRLEVPALEDGDLKIFDSTVILGYLEDKYDDKKKLLPASPADRARAKMIEEVCDTQYEAINWAYSEIVWSQRAEGELKDHLLHQIEHQTATIQNWLAEKLGDREFFNGDSFGYADVCVAPILHRSVYYGFGPAEGSPLDRWHQRIQQRQSVATTFAEMEEGAKVMSKGLKTVFIDGQGKREYRDHRLEWLVKSGGIDIVLEGLKQNNIRFSWPHAK